MVLLFFTILFFIRVNAVSTECINGTQPTNSSMSVTLIIENPSGQNISIFDNVTNLECDWGSSDDCYIQCDVLNTTKCLTNLMKKRVHILTHSEVQLTFMLYESNTLCNVTKCMDNLTEERMKYLNDIICTLEDWKRLLNFKNMCIKCFTYFDLIKQYIWTEKKCIQDIISNFIGETIEYDLEDTAMTVVKMNMSNAVNNLVNIIAPQILDITLPVDIQLPIEPFLNVSEVQSKVGVVTYTSPQQFMIGQENVSIVSTVIRIEVVGRNITNLDNPLSFNFTINETPPENFSLSCQYYDDEAYHWNQQNGNDNANDGHTVTCKYDHMTPFAVLLIDVKIDQEHWTILSYLSYVGCGLSVIFTAASVLTFIAKKDTVSDSSNHIHLSLSVALFLLNSSFLFSEWAASWSIEGVCVFVAVIIHYSLLSSFSWMAIEALHLYLLLVKVFNTYIQNYMVKLSLFGWGVPAIFVGASLSVYNVKAFYGTEKVTLLDNATKETKICWITDVNFLYGMNLTFFSFVFLFSTSILFTVTCQIFKLRRLSVKRTKLLTCKDICTVLGMTCLLGTTWGLAFLSEGYTNYPILYLFCILNTLQGFFMFLWIYATIRKNRRLAAQSLSPSDPHSSMEKTTKTTLSEISHHS